MSFEVLARKWRPQTFSEVVGQDHIVTTLKKAVQSERIVHAYMFSGPRGCGKTSTARILAKVINCTDIKSGDPCNSCPACRGVIEGKNLDVMEIDGATHTGVAEVRDLQESIGYAPSQHRNKVYIIDEVHMLSTNAFNALLKTLEEPPKHVYFIFATTAPHKIPETIKSRCQRHNFKRLDISEISSQLKKICGAESIEYEDEALRLLARKAEGSLRDGESLLDQCITVSSVGIKTETVRDILGFLDQDMVLGFLELISSKKPSEILRLLDKSIEEGVDLQELASALLDGFRDLMVLAAPGDMRELVYRSNEEIERMIPLLKVFEIGDLISIVEKLCNLVPRLKAAAEPRILIESTLVDLALLDRQTDIRTLIEKLDASGGNRAAGSQNTPKPPRGGKTLAGTSGSQRPDINSPGARVLKNAKTFSLTADLLKPEKPVKSIQNSSVNAPQKNDAQNAGTTEENFAGSWKRLVTAVRQKKVSLGVCLISGKLAGVQNEKIYLRYRKSFYPQMVEIESPSNRKFLYSMMNKILGKEMELVCLKEDAAVPSSSGDLEAKKTHPMSKSDLEKMPLASKIIRDFDGEIIQY